MTKHEIILDPITRIEGHMGVHAVLDDEKRKVVESHCYSTMFRGFEKILVGREPSDAIFITQRICGVCPVVHAYASTLANDMALNAPPPPLAISLRDLTDCAELLYDHAIHLFQLAGPEYSEAILSKFNRSWIDKAREYKCEYKDIHGYSTMYDLLKALNPLEGQLYLYTLKLEREARKLASLLGAKHPHINTFVPGGIARKWGISETEKALSLIFVLAGLAKLTVAVWEDISKFLYDAVNYDEVGIRAANLLCYGTVDDPESYNAKYEDMDLWGEKRLFTPGVVINGELITTKLKEIHLNVRQDISHSYYEKWDKEVDEDLEGNKIAAEHPWNKDTIHKPQSRDWNGKYSWGTAPRWLKDGELYALEAGPIARLYVSALAGKAVVTSPWAEVRTGNGEIRISLPETKSEMLKLSLVEAREFKWKVPSLKLEDGTPAINTIERNRARAYCHAYYSAISFAVTYNAISFIERGEVNVWKPFTKPKFSMGVGLNEAARGALGHWIIIKDEKIHRYQIITPSAWNISPKDRLDNPGPMEEAIKDTPITEESDPRSWTGIDILRIVRSYDPCLACTVYVFIRNINYCKRKVIA